MKYEEWRKLAVWVSDLRAIEEHILDGYDFRSVDKPVPGVIFQRSYHNPLKPDALPTYHNVGCMTQLEDGRWNVLISNEERQFASFEDAARWLWNDHWQHELRAPTRYRLIGVDREGGTYIDRILSDFDEVESEIRLLLPDKFYQEPAIRALSQVGSRFFEFPYGHYAAFPLDEE